MNRFDFENKIEQLVLHLESLISNVEHFSSEGSGKANQTANNLTKINHILSCQIVNFGSEAGKLNNYDVYNYCHTLKKYEDELEKHFKDTTKNKSILSIEKERNDDGIWYSKRVPKTNGIAEINLEYQQRTTVASYDVYSSEDECKAQWNNWRDLMFSIYENANSVFSKNIRIELSGKKYLYSGIYITFACRLNYKQIGIIGRICETLLNDVAFEDLIPNLHKNIQTHALQSAVAQVFARNFAHNIGSHVAIRATNRMAKERIEELYKIKKTDFKNTPEIESWLDYMGEKLDLFEVARNEFLAEYKLPAKNAMLYRDVILPFCENTLLMDNIAHSEGVHYKNTCENKLKIKVVINGVEIVANYQHLESHTNCEKSPPIAYPYNFPYLVKSTEGISIDEAFNKKELVAKENGKSVTDIEICLTNEHTLYSILENFIRNSAKHNKSEISEDKGLVITIDVKHFNDDYHTIQISDNVSKVSEKQLNDFALAIQTPLIGSDGETEKKSLGIADIKINAHLLRTDADITDRRLSEALTIIYDKEKNGIFEPYDKNKASQGDYNFGYQFKLCKPKKVIWIGQEDNPELKERGIICLKDYAKFKPEKGDNTDNPLASYQFAILELDAVKNLTNESPNYEWDDFLIKLPHRVLLNCREDESKKIEEDDVYRWIKDLKEHRRIQLVKQKIELPTEKEVDENENWDFDFLKDCWENWLRKWVKDDEKARLIVYFEDKSVADKWKEYKINNSFLDTIFITGKKPETTKCISVSDKDRIVIFDHHSEGYGWIDANVNLSFIERSSYLQFGKNSQDFVRFFYPQTDITLNELFLLEAFEAGLNKVAILDERICEMLGYSDAAKNIREKITKNQGFKAKLDSVGDYADLANNGNIFIVTTFLDNIITPDNANGKITLLPKNIFELTLPKEVVLKEGIQIDSLIIHRTYLNNLFDKFQYKFTKKELMNLLYKSFKRVTVVSGGGYPHSIDFKVSFKPYSQLKQNFIQYPSKVSLNQII